MKGTIEAHDADHPNPWQQIGTSMCGTRSWNTRSCAELNYRDYVVGRPKLAHAFLYAGAAVFTHDPEGHWMILENPRAWHCSPWVRKGRASWTD